MTKPSSYVCKKTLFSTRNDIIYGILSSQVDIYYTNILFIADTP